MEISWRCGALFLLKKISDGLAKTGHFQCLRSILRLTAHFTLSTISMMTFFNLVASKLPLKSHNSSLPNPEATQNAPFCGLNSIFSGKQAGRT